MNTDPLVIVRDVLGLVQSASYARDVDSASALFTDDAVLMGTTATSIGAAAVRDYLRQVYDQPDTIRWDWEDLRIVHTGSGVVVAVGTGRVGFADDPERDRFRLTLVLVETGRGWLIQHFHGSIPSG